MRIRNALGARAVARRLGVPASTLAAWNESGVGPLPDTHGRYDVNIVIEWQNEMAHRESLEMTETGKVTLVMSGSLNPAP